MSDVTKDNPFYIENKKKLDDIGKGMCLAKWTQVTLQLQTGHNHSCHHPRTHKISEKEIARNPSALHNTQYKKMRRREMLTDKRPEECDYCWGVEDNSDRFSDRVFKSSENWSLPHFDEIVNADWRDNINPRYVEVAFSNACNFKCSYCGPPYSSTWMNEIKQHGAYPTTDKFNGMEGMIEEDKVPILHKDYNPYVDAFWKWWPELYRDLHTFRITGGEPMLAKDTWKVLDYIIDEPNPNKDLNFAINSNLGLEDNMIDKLIGKINKIEDEDRVTQSPGLISLPSTISNSSTIPVQNPARSYLPVLYILGISAVSPPKRSIPDCSHPSTIPSITASNISVSNLPVAM